MNHGETPLALTSGAAGPAVALHESGPNSYGVAASLQTAANKLPNEKENGETQSTIGRITKCCDAPGLEESKPFQNDLLLVAGKKWRLTLWTRDLLSS